ncbi:MAG TPA: hypothetical protein VNZ22_19195, partial [Bacillota bacterium]|nr:hypothetical protein [Bacillota bacterium]
MANASVLTAAHRAGLLVCVLALLAGVAPPAAAQTDQPIYTDALQNGWQDWGWATLNYNNSSPVHSGSKSVAVTIANGSGQAIYIAHGGFDASPYTNLTFWIHGGPSGGQQLQVQGHAGGVSRSAVPLPPLAANTWQQITLSLSSLGVANR